MYHLPVVTPMPSNRVLPEGGSRTVLVFALVVGLLASGAAGLAAAQDDQFEPNDDFDTASELERGTYTGLEVANQDFDVYAVELEEGQTVTASIDFSHSQGDVDLLLIDGSNADSIDEAGSNDLLAQSLSVSDGESITYTADSSGTYYFAVFSWDGRQNTYDLTLESDQPIQPGGGSGLLGGDNTVLLLGAAAVVVVGYFVFVKE